jgi:hypothetical protein
VAVYDRAPGSRGVPYVLFALVYLLLRRVVWLTAGVPDTRYAKTPDGVHIAYTSSVTD